MAENKCKWLTGVRTLLIIDGGISPISRVLTPVTHIFSAVYRGSNSMYN